MFRPNPDCLTSEIPLQFCSILQLNQVIGVEATDFSCGHGSECKGRSCLCSISCDRTIDSKYQSCSLAQNTITFLLPFLFLTSSLIRFYHCRVMTSQVPSMTCHLFSLAH